MALQVADQVHQVDVVARLQLLSDLQRAVELKRLGLWLSVWRQVRRSCGVDVWAEHAQPVCVLCVCGHLCVCVCVHACL